MSEKLHNIENQNNSENLKSNETEISRHEKELTKAERDHGSEDSISQIAKKVEQTAKSSAELRPHTQELQKSSHPVLVNKQLKDMAYSRALTRTRKQLSKPSKVFSKAVHSKALDKPSEYIGKTVARPSSMLGGAIFALVGTSTFLWIAKRYGYEYNYLAVALFFAVGMAIGLVVEFLLKVSRKSK